MTKPMIPTTLAAVMLATACAGTTSPATTSPVTPRVTSKSASINLAQVELAQRAWCDALIEIGRVGASGGDAQAVAAKVLSTAYDYDTGTVLFKPTLTFGSQTFRMSRAGALAYFVGGDPSYPDDKGFARKQWVKCEPTIAGIVAADAMAVAMGKVALEDVHGNQVTVDKTFGYRRTDDGQLRIVVHHSSLPYSPPK